MELNIQKKEDRPLLQAQDIHAELTFENTTPSRKELAKLIADKTKSKPEQVIVRKIQGVFGDKKAMVLATIYKDVSLLQKVENQPLIKRHKGKEETKAESEQAPAAPATQQAPTKTEEKSAPKAEEKNEQKTEEKPATKSKEVKS